MKCVPSLLPIVNRDLQDNPFILLSQSPGSRTSLVDDSWLNSTAAYLDLTHGVEEDHNIISQVWNQQTNFSLLEKDWVVPRLQHNVPSSRTRAK
jgi:hypothetical protein